MSVTTPQEDSNGEPQLGYRMPAEWEPQQVVWVCPPSNPETWWHRLEQAQAQFSDLLDALQAVVRVRDVCELGVKPYDAWIRDYAPIFVKRRRDGRIACHEFTFNAWGRKYEPWDQDNLASSFIARDLRCPTWCHNMVLEGGSIDVNGASMVMTTEQCLLHSNRNSTMSRDQIEQQLRSVLGVDHVIWLQGGIAGDDTDGHVDQVARFIHSDVVAAVRAPPPDGHCDHAVLESNWRVLQQQPINLVELPVPEPLFFDFPASRFAGTNRQQLPASYANFLICNGVVLVPIFGQATDDRALRILDDAMDDHRMIGVRCEHLLVGLGTIHCLTMQQPM